MAWVNLLYNSADPGKMDTPTKMALVQGLNGLKMKNGWLHHVPLEKIYKLCRFDILKTFGSELALCSAKWVLASK
jgi:hypothetical protein